MRNVLRLATSAALLTALVGTSAFAEEPMKKDSMSKGEMSHDGMKKDGMKKEDGHHDGMAKKDSMKKDEHAH